MLKKVMIPKISREVCFVHRKLMKMRAGTHTFKHAKSSPPPPTPLPVDSTGNATVSCPMDGNDKYGDCGEAMAAHVDNILTFRQGKGVESVFDLKALEAQYLRVSGGDNGLDENDVVNSIWKVGIAGNKDAVICDALDIDVTNITLAQFAIDNFYTIQMAWSVPDNFINGFNTGTEWLTAAIPDPNNGHYTPLADVRADGAYRLWTWGSWCWAGPKFVASVQPQCFVAFSPRQFDKATGLDSKGRHITTQAALWQQCGGNPIPQNVIDAFPPIGGPTPTPIPTPTPVPPVPPAPTPTPAPVPVGVQLADVIAADRQVFSKLLIDFKRIHGAKADLMGADKALEAMHTKLFGG